MVHPAIGRLRPSGLRHLRAAGRQARPTAPAPARAAARAAQPAPAAAGGAAAEDDIAAAYAALASLVASPGCPSRGALAAGATPLGRGLVAARRATAGEPLLSVEAWNALVVSDDPSGPGRGAYGARCVDDWEEVRRPGWEGGERAGRRPSPGLPLPPPEWVHPRPRLLIM
jgi:hypothetical protein